MYAAIGRSENMGERRSKGQSRIARRRIRNAICERKVEHRRRSDRPMASIYRLNISLDFLRIIGDTVYDDVLHVKMHCGSFLPSFFFSSEETKSSYLSLSVSLPPPLFHVDHHMHEEREPIQWGSCCSCILLL